MRRTLWLVAVVILIAVIAWTVMLRMPGKSQTGSPAPLRASEVVLKNYLRRVVEALTTEIGERNFVHYDALAAAGAYLEKELISSGYTVESHDFPVTTPSGPGTARNLIAEVKGDRKPADIVIIGAHYDSREGTPGADDNASGTAALLSLAHTFASATPDRTLRFVFFTNEEYFRQNLMGSLVYARRCRARNEHIVAMLSLETIGYYSDIAGSQKYPFPINLFYPSTGDFLGFVGNVGSGFLVRSAIGSYREVATLPSEGVAAPEFIEGVGWSDHWSFWQVGYPGIMITDTAPFRNPNYHRASDTADTLDYVRLARVVTGLQRVVQDLGTGK